jgi:hypothetical protein
MCCGIGSQHGGYHWGHHPAGFCGCGGHSLGACFPTKEEKIAQLERYLEGLQEATKTVKDRIAVLKEAE